MTPAQLRASLSTLGLSQARAAALLGVTTDAVSKWANGKRAIPGPVARLVFLMTHPPQGASVRALLESCSDGPEQP